MNWRELKELRERQEKKLRLGYAIDFLALCCLVFVGWVLVVLLSVLVHP